MKGIRTLSLICLSLSVSLLGCSKNNPNAPAKISGSVSYNGKPIKAGAMRFHTPSGTAYDALISTDGTYSATDVPTGELIVTVETESLNPANSIAAGKGHEAEMRMRSGGSMQQRPGSNSSSSAPAEKPSDHYIKIPKKYSNPKTSPLTVTVSAGRNVKDIELTD